MPKAAITMVFHTEVEGQIEVPSDKEMKTLEMVIEATFKGSNTILLALGSNKMVEEVAVG